MSNDKMNSQISKKPQQGLMPGGGRGGWGMQMSAGDKPKDFKGTLRKLFNYIAAYRLSIAAVILFAIASTIFAILSPRILGNITNEIVSDYTNMTIYDQVTANLPAGITLPAGTKRAVLIENAPSEIVNKIPSDKLESIKKMDFSKRPGINFDAIGQTILLLIGLYLLSALFNYIMG